MRFFSAKNFDALMDTCALDQRLGRSDLSKDKRDYEFLVDLRQLGLPVGQRPLVTADKMRSAYILLDNMINPTDNLTANQMAEKMDNAQYYLASSAPALFDNEDDLPLGLKKHLDLILRKACLTHGWKRIKDLSQENNQPLAVREIQELFVMAGVKKTKDGRMPKHIQREIDRELYKKDPYAKPLKLDETAVWTPGNRGSRKHVKLLPSIRPHATEKVVFYVDGWAYDGLGSKRKRLGVVTTNRPFTPII